MVRIHHLLSLILFTFLLCLTLGDQLQANLHSRARVQGSQEEKTKAEARNIAEKKAAQDQVNEEEKKKVDQFNKAAEDQEEKNEKFIQHCKREEREAEEARRKASVEAKAEVEIINEEYDKAKKDENKVNKVNTICNIEFNSETDHADCSGLISSTPTISTYDVLAWDTYKASLSTIPKSSTTDLEYFNITMPLPKEKIELLKFPTAIPKCWSIIKQCIPTIDHFTPAEALVDGMKDGSNPDDQSNTGLGPLLKSFGIIDMMNNKLESLSLANMLPDKMKGIAPMLENIVGPKKLYDLNVKPLLENTNSLWGDRLFDQVCGFFPGILPPIAPRETKSKFGPHVLVPQLPILPNKIRFPIGELTLTKEGGLHISESMYKMLLQFGPMLPGIKVMGTEMKLDTVLKMVCSNGNCPSSLAKMIMELVPGDMFKGMEREPTSFTDLINYLINKYTGGKISLGTNVQLPPPLSMLWGETLLNKHGPESCTLSAFPMQNTIEYHYDDASIVKQYCNLANYIWCNGKPNTCDRPGGAIFAHSTGALSLLKGLENGDCRNDMKINIIDAPLKGISLLELLHRRDELWCARSHNDDKYFDDFWNDIIKVTPVCGNKGKSFISRFGTSIGGLLSTLGSSFKETGVDIISVGYEKTSKDLSDEATISLIDSMDTSGHYDLRSRTYKQQQAFIALFHNLPEGNKATINKKHDIMKSFSLLETKHKLHAISLFRRLDIEDQKRNLPKGAIDEDAEKAMENINFDDWSKDDQNMLINLFERQAFEKDNINYQKRERMEEIKLKNFVHPPSYLVEGVSFIQEKSNLRKKRQLLTKRLGTDLSKLKRRGWFKKTVRSASKVVTKTVKAVVNFVVPHIKTAAQWINENAIKPTVAFTKKYIIEPAANFLNNCVSFFKGLVSFNPRETIAGIIRNVICGKSGVKHKIAWGTSNKNVASIDLGLVDKAITDGVSKIKDFMASNFNDPDFGLQLEEILEHLKKLSPSRMALTTLSETAKKHTLGIHCGGSFLGLPLPKPIPPDTNLFGKLWTPNILKDITSMVSENLNKNKLLMGVKNAIGSCGATMMVDKAFPWMMNAIPGIAECVPILIEPWLNEDSTNGISETRSCGDSIKFGDQKASKLASSSFIETSELRLLSKRSTTRKKGVFTLPAAPPVIIKPQSAKEEEETIQKNAASKVIEIDDASITGRCLPKESSSLLEIDSTATKAASTKRTSGCMGTDSGCGPGGLMIVVSGDACINMKDKESCVSSKTACKWEENKKLGHIPATIFPDFLPDLREFALEQEESLKSIHQINLEKECNVNYIPHDEPSNHNGGYNPIVLTDEGFLVMPNSKKYLSNCNYLNTMGISGNDPSSGCAPHCWMGFRLLELQQMRNSLTLPDPLPEPLTRPPLPEVKPGDNYNENQKPIVDGQLNENTKDLWTADPNCIMVNDPYDQRGYYGYIVDVDDFNNPKDISSGIRELIGLISMIDMHPSIPADAKDVLKKCEPRMKNVMRDFMLPVCNEKCQIKKPCQSWCREFKSDCLSHPAVVEILTQVIDGNSPMRNMALSMLGKKEGRRK